MASTAITAQGTTLEIDNTTQGTADQAIANVISYAGFDGEASEIDITNMSSTAKEKLAGLQDFGNFTFEFHPDYSDAGQEALRAAQTSGALKTFQLTLSDATTIDFTGVVRNAQALNGAVDSALTSSCTISVSGAITIT